MLVRLVGIGFTSSQVASHDTHGMNNGGPVVTLHIFDLSQTRRRLFHQEIEKISFLLKTWQRLLKKIATVLNTNSNT